MPPITNIAPISRHRLILYSFVVIAPITASNIPVAKTRQEMTACFCGLLFFIWSRSFVNFRFVFLKPTQPHPAGKAFPLGGRWRGTRRMRGKCPEGSPSSVTCGDSFPQKGEAIAAVMSCPGAAARQTGICNYIPYILAFFTITLSPFSNCSLEIPRNPSPTCSVLYPQPFDFRSFVCVSMVVIIVSNSSPFVL